MILNLTPLEDAWGIQPVAKNMYKSNEPQRKFLSSGMNFEDEDHSVSRTQVQPNQKSVQPGYQSQKSLQPGYQSQKSLQPGYQANSAVTKNDIYQSGLFHQRRVDVALYNDIVIDKLGDMNADEKTFHVTNALLEYRNPRQQPPTSKRVEYFNNPHCNEYHTFGDDKPNNDGIDLLWIFTVFLILLLFDKVYTLWKNS